MDHFFINGSKFIVLFSANQINIVINRNMGYFKNSECPVSSFKDYLHLQEDKDTDIRHVINKWEKNLSLQCEGNLNAASFSLSMN